MVNQIEDLKKLKEIINDRRVSTISDSDIRTWYNNLSDKIEPLCRRYRIFSIGSFNRYLILVLLIILLNVFLNSFGFYSSALSIIISLCLWGGIILLYLYLSEYFDFVSEIIEREKKTMRKELISLLFAQEELFKEALERKLFEPFIKEYQKNSIRYQKLLNKLLKDDIPLYN